jgi:isoleucyl-tRNA synthetase
MRGMVENRPDWCISRQRLWGVPITVLYCESCNESITTPDFFARVTALFRKEGADAWFEHPPADFLPPNHRCACGSQTFRKEQDILDVWFDSGCSHIAVLRKRPELTWPAAVYLEGHDQHRGWFQSSLLIGTGIEGSAPYQQVITCGFVLDEKGRKMSKSQGNDIPPQDIIKQHGADILRMWVAMIDYRDDMAVGKEIVARIAEAYRKIRNTARYLLANLYDFDPDKDALPVSELLPVDRWILDRANHTFERCRQAYEEYEFHVVYHRVLDLCTVDLSAVYLDVSKDTVYIEAPSSPSRRSAQTAMWRIVRGLVGVLAPIVPFTSEEIYEAIPGAKEKSVHLTMFPRSEGPAVDAADLEAWERIFALREAVTKVLERARAAQQIGQSLEADIALHANFGPEALLGNVAVDLAKMFIVSHVDFATGTAADVIDIKGLGPIGITMSPARGKKCGRCWNYREEVATEGDVCGRCADILEGLTPVDAPTA